MVNVVSSFKYDAMSLFVDPSVFVDTLAARKSQSDIAIIHYLPVASIRGFPWAVFSSTGVTAITPFPFAMFEGNAAADANKLESWPPDRIWNAFTGVYFTLTCFMETFRRAIQPETSGLVGRFNMKWVAAAYTNGIGSSHGS